MKLLRQGFLQQKHHSIAWWERGDPDGFPVLLLHGGPGSAGSEEHLAPFGPGWKVVSFDQRGCGHSLPSLEMRNNTTEFLLQDIEELRKGLQIDSWVLCGGSWGSTLAMLYGQAYPERTLGFLLRGIFLCRQRDIGWIFEEGGASRLRPDEWKAMTDVLQPKEGESLFVAFARGWRDPKRRMTVSRAWAKWEDCLGQMDWQKEEIDGKAALEKAALEHHYLASRGFIKENQVIDNIDLVSHLPCIIVHGRYDLVCPLEQASTLHRAWPGSELRLARESSHVASEPGIKREMKQAAEDMLFLLSQEG